MDSEFVWMQTEGVFRCLADNDDNFSETPLWQHLFFVLMDQCCVTEESFLSKKVVICGCEDSANSFWLFFLFSTESCRCHMKGRWQSIICLFSEWGKGELDCDGWCWDAFSYWPEKTGPQCELAGGMFHKNMSIQPINIFPNHYPCVVGFIIQSSELFACRLFLLHHIHSKVENLFS